jgi:hypothetical protein
MSSDALFLTWSRPLPGQEQLSAQHFAEFHEYLADLERSGEIEAFDAVSDDADVNEFFLIQGDTRNLDALTTSPEWVNHMIRASKHLGSMGAIWGVTSRLVIHQIGMVLDSFPLAVDPEPHTASSL